MDKPNFDLLEKVSTHEDVCKKHGTNLVTVGSINPFCTECQREFVENKTSLIVKREEERDFKRRTIKTLKLDSLVSDISIVNASFGTYESDNAETKAAYDRARQLAYKYLNRENCFNTILTGIPGTGKSHLAMSMLKAVNENFDPLGSCLFVSVNELMRRIKDSFNNKQSKYTEANMVKLLGDVDLLVLDDLGSESAFRSKDRSESTEYTQNVLFGILERRNRTIITTNLTSKELREIYNPKIVSRLYKGLSQESMIKFTKETRDKRTKFDF